MQSDTQISVIEVSARWLAQYTEWANFDIFVIVVYGSQLWLSKYLMEYNERKGL